MLELLTPEIKHSLDKEPKTLTYHFTLPIGGDEKTFHGLEMYPCSFFD
jgi:hypothetical protein